MVETLEHLIRQAAQHPRQTRSPLYKELLRSDTFLLTVDSPISAAQITRISRGEDTFPIWADKDPELGGVWVPLFPARDAVAQYVSAKSLQAPPGKEFLWMAHQPGTIFSLMGGVKCFAGMRLYLDEASSLDIPWSDVKTLSEGRLPADAPEVYELPVAKIVLPAGSKIAFGAVNVGPGDPKGKLLCIPDAGHFRAEDIRKLVRLPLGARGTAWMACRHFLQVLRFIHDKGRGSQRYWEDVLCSLIGFQMYGEAEALCEWLVKQGREIMGWMALAAVYAKTGRLAECAELCRDALSKCPKESSFAVSGAKALSKLGREKEAADLLERALKRAPRDLSLLQALREIRR
ncbi:MAG: tetratricopeptide repeat protein [Elusimicrobia bacterium]|nr:tetratricopeptide repeat protein [Elusimicrobiota bacterium]